VRTSHIALNNEGTLSLLFLLLFYIFLFVLLESHCGPRRIKATTARGGIEEGAGRHDEDAKGICELNLKFISFHTVLSAGAPNSSHADMFSALRRRRRRRRESSVHRPLQPPLFAFFLVFFNARASSSPVFFFYHSRHLSSS